MKFVEEQLYSTITYAASTQQPLLIGPKTYFITAIGFEYLLSYNTGTTPLPNQDAMYRGITSLSVQGGGRPYLKVASPDARIFYWGNRVRTRGRFKITDMATGTGGQAALKNYHYLPWICGVHPLLANGNLNFFDGSAAIPPDPDLTVLIGWGAAGSSTTQSLWGTNIGAATTSLVRLTLYGIVPETAAEEPKYFPVWQSSQYTPTQTYASLQGLTPLSPGFYYRRTTLMELAGNAAATLPIDYRVDGTGTSTNAGISEIGIKTADGRFPLNVKTWDLSQQSQGTGFSPADDNQARAENGRQGTTALVGVSDATCPYNPGVQQIDWVQYADTKDPTRADPQYGINMNGKNVGTVQIATTVDYATNVSLVQLHECYNPL